ncbi:type IX secretion system sortase PorU [candidate division TA06 bacterium]|uniref:Type IX secretion system sortase PorU n=1 Tax=candidate division TA06 bacterium TaxID=2250710 RepID=A0A933I7P6_UNCT6|nr:type IX secretion system sortase PorU [candidate division TA06 bacterium]
MTKKQIIIICTIGFMSVPALAQIKLLKSGDSEALISCHFAPVSFTLNDLGQTRPSISGCQTEGEPGQPISLYRQVMVGIPQNARVEVKMLSGEYDEYSGIDLAPVPFLEAKGQNDLGSYVYRKNDNYYQSKGLFPQTPVLLHFVDMLRRHRVAWVKVYPTQYDPVSKKLRIYRSIQVQVTWDIPGRPSVISDDEVYGPILADQIINYSQSKSWLAEYSKSGAKADDPFAAAPVWYKLSVVSQGIYRMDYNYLKRNGINPDIIDPRTIKIYNGGSRAFSKSYIPPTADSLKQMSIMVKGEQDGKFDAGDQIVFFGQSLAGWDKNSALLNGHFYNPYGETNSYWLCWGGTAGLRMAERDCRPISLNYIAPQSFNDTLHFEQDAFNPFNSGELWYWLSLKRMTGEAYHDYSLPFDLSYAMPGSARIKIDYRSGTNGNHHLNWGVNGILYNGKKWTAGPDSGPFSDSLILPDIPASNNTINLQLDRDAADTMDIVYLNWFEVYYRRNYQAFNYNLKFRADSLAGQPYRFRLTGFASDSLTILDISNPEKPVNIKSDRIYQSYSEFEDVWRKGRFYWAAASPGWQRPVKIEPYASQNLRQKYLTVNYLVITADEFWPQVQALLNLHAGESRLQPMAAVKLSWIYNEFSFGLKDPSAIRKFLDHIYLNSNGPNPKRCLLFGDGSYDYREIDKTWGRHNFIPTHQEDGLRLELGEYLFDTFDDWYVRLNGLNLPQLILARIPAKNADEAWTVVNKVFRYKSASGDMQWRNRAILVADDEFVSGGSYSGETIHTTDSESLAQYSLPDSYDIEKVYGVMREYPMDSDKHKSDARNALISNWNIGAGIINFFGHGAYWVWGHEWYFRDTDVANLANGDKLPLVVMGTCGTSRFDMNRYESIGTSLVVKSGGGAIATVGATRGTGSNGNFNLAKGIYDSLFKRPYDIGQAVYNGKLASGGNHLYILMGDPALYLAKPAGVCSLVLNDDTLKSRGLYSVKGKISGLTSSFNGQALLTLYDAVRTDSSLYTHSLKFKIPGQPLVKFGAMVQNDSLSASFILPNISSLRSETLSGARLGVYAWGSNADVSGVLGGDLWIGGTDTAALSDTVKPNIELWANDVKLINGDPVGTSSRLAVKVRDDAGLNVIPFSASQTDQVQLLINDKELKNLSDDFIFDIGSTNSGQALWTVPENFKIGSNKLRLSACDLASNKGVLEINLNVLASSGENKIDGVYNYPNPFRQSTCFTFNLYQEGDVTIKIYTIGGRMIKTLAQNGRSFGYHQIYWDGRDADGSLLANGVYFYKITVKGQSGEASAIGKMVVMK